MKRRTPIMPGMVFGQLTVLAQSNKSRPGNTRWVCECSCGDQDVYSQHVLALAPSQEKRGIRPRTCCDACRTRTCRVCGETMPYRHGRFVCDDGDCRDKDYTLRTGKPVPTDLVEKLRHRKHRAQRRAISNRHNARLSAL